MSEYNYIVRDGKRIPEHRAVIEDLLGITLRKDQVVHHINGNKTDNRPENLQVMDWAEHSRLHASAMPQSPEKLRKLRAARKGKSNLSARTLTEPQVEAIVIALHKGESVTAVSKRLSVSDHVVRDIRDGKTYRDILEKLPQEYFPLPRPKKRAPSSKGNRKLNVAELNIIRLELLQGKSIASIAKEHRLAQETVRRISTHESHTEIPWPEELARYDIVDDMKQLADRMLQGPLPEEEDGFSFTEEDIQALTGEKVDEILMKNYGLFPTYHARLVYLMMRRALSGDRTMLFALFSVSSYDALVPQILFSTSKAINNRNESGYAPVHFEGE